MQVIKPFEVNDSNLTTAITEPDASLGEALWVQDRPNFYSLNDVARGLVALGDYIYVVTHNGIDGTRVYQYSKDGAQQGFFAAPSLSKAITTDGTDLYIVQNINSSTANVYQYNTAGTQLNTFVVTFNQAGSAFSNDTAICFLNGLLYIPNYGPAFSSITAFDAANGNLIYEYDVSAVVGLFNGITINNNRFYSSVSNNGITSVYSSDFVFSSFEYQSSITLNNSYCSSISFDGSVYWAASTSSVNKVYGFVSDDWQGAGVYLTGEQAVKLSTHKIYQATKNTKDDPEVGVSLVPPSWVEVSATNKYRTFDFVRNQQTVSNSPFVMSFTFAQISNAIAIFNISGATYAKITVTDPIDGIVYENEVDLVDTNPIINMWQYFFYQHAFKDRIILDDLPPYKDATIEVYLSNITASPIGVGEIVIGNGKLIGEVVAGTSTDRKSYSRIETDEFGNDTVIKRPSATYTSFSISAPVRNAQYIESVLKGVIDEPTLFIGDDVDGVKLADLGYYELSPLVRSNPSRLEMNIKVRGLV